MRGRNEPVRPAGVARPVVDRSADGTDLRHLVQQADLFPELRWSPAVVSVDEGDIFTTRVAQAKVPRSAHSSINAPWMLQAADASWLARGIFCCDGAAAVRRSIVDQ